MLYSILRSRLAPYIDEIIGDKHYGFRRNRSSTDQVFYIRQMMEKNGRTMGQYISYLYDSVRREVLQNILTEFGISMKVG
jgi:hypothetical protein